MYTFKMFFKKSIITSKKKNKRTLLRPKNKYIYKK